MDVPWYAGHGGCLVVRLMGAIEVFFWLCNKAARYSKVLNDITKLTRQLKGSKKHKGSKKIVNKSV